MSNFHSELSLLDDEARVELAKKLHLLHSRQQLIAFYSTHENAGNSDLNADIKKTLTARLPDFMQPDVLIALDDIPVLSNGKVDNKTLLASAAAHLQNSNKAKNDQISADKFENSTEQHHLALLISLLENLLGFEGIEPEDNFFELGGDSITAIRYVSRAREAGLNISVADIGKCKDMTDLSHALLNNTQQALSSDVSSYGGAPLTPIQRWFFSVDHPDPAHWNTGIKLSINRKINSSKLCDAINRCVNQHPELGVQFHKTHDHWAAIYPEASSSTELCSVISTDNDNSFDTFLTSEQQRFSLSNGWMLKFGIVENEAAQASALFLVAHHLILDQLSIQTLLAEIEHILNSETETETAPTYINTSVREWALKCEQRTEQLKNHDDSPKHSLLNTANTNWLIGTDHYTQEQKTSHFVRELNEQQTTQLIGFSQQSKYSVSAIILSAIAKAWQQTLRNSLLPLDIEGHGRGLLGEQVDVGETIGWFSNFYPADYKITSAQSDLQLVQSTHKHLERCKTENIQFLLHEYFEFAQQNTLQARNGRILFNHFGHTGTSTGSTSINNNQNQETATQLFTEEPFNLELLRSARNYRTHNIEINSALLDNTLSIRWQIAHECLPTDSEALLMDNSLDFLINLINADVSDLQSTDSTYSPEQFEDIDMDQAELDQFLDSLE